MQPTPVQNTVVQARFFNKKSEDTFIRITLVSHFHESTELITNLNLYSFAIATHTATTYSATIWLKTVKLSKSWGGAKNHQAVRKSLPQVTKGPPLNRKNEEKQIWSLWVQNGRCRMAIKKQSQDNSYSSERNSVKSSRRIFTLMHT